MWEPVSGVCIIIKESGDGLPYDPNYRVWYKDDWSMGHWRHNLFLFDCDFTDDRLDGYQIVSDSWNFINTPNGEYLAITMGTSHSADVNGNPLDLWEASHNGRYDQDWNYTSHTIYKGRGIYQGLLVKFLVTSPVGAFPLVYFDGELLDPGK